MNTRNAKVPPFVDEERERLIQQTRQSAASYVVLAFGWTLLTIAMMAGAYLIYGYLTRDPKNTYPSITASLIILALTYLVGWVVSLISIRMFYSLIMSAVIKIYSFGVLGGILFVYGRAIYKILVFVQGGDPNTLPTFSKYFSVLFVGYLLLVSLYLLVSNFNLVPHAVVLLVAISVHLVIGVYHYVFKGVAPEGLISYDLYFILTILLIAFLLFQKRLYVPIKRPLVRMFSDKQRSQT